MNRRSFANLLALSPIGFIAGCGYLTSPNATPFEMLKAYASVTSDAVSAAAQSYLSSKPAPSAKDKALVKKIVADLQATKDAILAAAEPANARQMAQEILTGVQTLMPMVSAFLGAAAPYVPVALGVIQAFINALPPPPDAPAKPPAELQRKAMAFHRDHSDRR